jgi:phosphoribosylformylglycinamidine synthase
MVKVRVDVMPKEGVLDPQGKAIGHALESLGFKGIGDVRAGKVIMLNIDEKNPEKAEDVAKKMAEKLLANLVIEDYRISLV